jgi:hypothetical protein
MQRLALLAAAAFLAAPAIASAAPADPLLDVFKNVCVAHAGDYAGTVNAAKASGWSDAAGIDMPADANVSITSEAALIMPLNGANLTLLISSGLQHMRSGDTPETTCRIESNKPDAQAIDATKGWLGLQPNGGDASLAYFFVTGTPDRLVRISTTTIPPAGMSLIKVQQDAGSAIFIDQFFAGKHS